jgi:hypothetical protein
MCNRILVSVTAMTLVAVLSWSPLLIAQVQSRTQSIDPTAVDPQAAIKAHAEAATAESAAAANWRPPRTAWGDPDVQGYWLTATYTPLQRPPELAGKAFYTEEEALAAFKKAVEADAEVDPRTVHYDWKEYAMDAWQSPVRPNRRTSLIVDPENGRIPPLTAEAQKRQADARTAAAKARNPQVGVQTLGNLYTRCVTGNNAGPLTRGGQPGSDSAAGAAGVTAEAQLLQSPGYAVLITQSNSDARIIPLDGRPRLPSTVRNYLGDSRGHFEGDTLVVETTNFIVPGTNFFGGTNNMKLIERFTRVGPNTLRYEFTLDDPNTWTRPWTAETLLPRVDPPLYEFACHEDNYGLMNVVKGAQIREAEAKAKNDATK